MRNIVDEAGEIIAKATDDHTLIGGHHRLAVAASLGKKLFWKHTGEPVKLDPFFKGSSEIQPDAPASAPAKGRSCLDHRGLKPDARTLFGSMTPD